MESFKGVIRRFWFWFSLVLCLLAVVTWSAGGSLLGGLISCVVTAIINLWLLRWLLPARADKLICNESFLGGLRFGLPYLALAAIALAISVTRTQLTPPYVVDIGAVISFIVIAAAEVFLLMGPVLQLMMNRYAKDDVGVFLAVLYTGLSYGIVYFAYSATYMISIEGASVIAACTQGVYMAMLVMFLAAVYLRTENFYLVMLLRVFGLLLERGMELVTPQAASIGTLVGLNKTDCIILIVAALALGVLAMFYSTNVPPWDKGDFREKKRREPLVQRNIRLQDPKLPRGKKK